MRRSWSLAALLVIAGCGGSGGGGNGTPANTTRPVLDIEWAARSRAFEGPSSALSATITYVGARPNGEDLTFNVDRPEEIRAQIRGYQTPSAVTIGPTTIRIEFHAQSGGKGIVVGNAETAAVVNAEGTLANSDGAPLGRIVIDSKVAAVAVPAGQRVRVGETKTLVYTALDADGNVLAVTPGSFSTLTYGTDLRVNGDGSVTGMAAGETQITVTIDGKQITQNVTVDPADSLAVSTLEIKVGSIVYSPRTGRLYASAKGDDPRYANRIVVIDPATAAVTTSVPIGSEPSELAISGDGKTIYVGLNGESALRRFDADTNQAGDKFSLSSNPLDHLYAEDIAVHPTSGNTVAVSLAQTGISPRHKGVAIFDNGVARPGRTPEHTGANRIEWSDRGDLIFGINNETSSFNLYKLAVNAQGVTVALDQPNVFERTSDIVFGDGRLYGSEGKVIDAGSFGILGTFPMGWGSRSLTLDLSARRLYTIEGSNSPLTLNTYRLDNFDLIQEKTISTYIGPPKQMIRAGADRLAIASEDGRIAIIDQSQL